MALDIGSVLSNFNSAYGILLLIIFILFVLSMKKIFRIVMNAVWIVVAAVLFPIFANRVLGLPVPADTDSIVLLVTAGLGLYFVYLVAKSVYSVLSFADKLGRRAPPKTETRGERKEKPEKMEKPVRGEPVPKQYFTQSGKIKPENELFKDYLVIEDREAPEETAGAGKKVRKEGYVELDKRGNVVEREDGGEAELKGPGIEKVPEIKFRKKAKGGKTGRKKK